jgi:hypothetical protein
MAVVELKIPVEKYADAAVGYLAKNAKSFEEVRITAAALESVGKRQAPTEVWNQIVEEEGRKKAREKDYARDMASVLVTQLRLGKEVGSLDVVVVGRLRKDQRNDGGYAKPGARGSDLETTYRVMRFFHMRKAEPDAAKVREFIAKCRNDDGGYGVAPGQPSSVGGTYFAAIITHWLK